MPDPMSDSTPATAARIPYEGTDCTPEEAVEAVKAVRDLQRRIDRTVGYLRLLLSGPLDSTTAMVAEAAIEGLTRPALPAGTGLTSEPARSVRRD